jgi:hypothetical protein
MKEVEPPPEVILRLRTCLDRPTPTLREAFRAAVTERTFPPHPRFNGRRVQALDGHDSVCGIHVEYSFPGWVPSICGLSRAGALECGARHPFGLGPSLVDADLDQRAWNDTYAFKMGAMEKAMTGLERAGLFV